MGEDVGALQRLGEEAEDVVDEQDGGVGGRGAGDVCWWEGSQTVRGG